MVDSNPQFDCLPDPYKDRQLNTCEPPPNKPLNSRLLFPYSGIRYSLVNRWIIVISNIGSESHKPDWKLLKTFLLREGKIKKENVI